MMAGRLSSLAGGGAAVAPTRTASELGDGRSPVRTAGACSTWMTDASTPVHSVHVVVKLSRVPGSSIVRVSVAVMKAAASVTLTS
jgi:hypothetical protein